MRFLMLYRPEGGDDGGPGPECAARVAPLVEEMISGGVLLAAEGCMPSAKGAKVRLSAGRTTVTDGPFAEAKELVAGLSLIETHSKEEATEYARRFMELAGDGEMEVRQIFERHDFADCEPASHSQPSRELAGVA
jgi:hypothetical protein